MRLNENVPQISLSELLRKLAELRGSDLHITTGSAPQVRVDGHLRPLESYRVLTSADTKQLAYSVLTDAQKHRFEENLELDFSFGVKGLSRFRANLPQLYVASPRPRRVHLQRLKVSQLYKQCFEIQ